MLLESLNLDELGCEKQHQLFKQLKLSSKSVKESLSAYPKDGCFKVLPDLIKRVDNAVGPEFQKARSTLEKEIWYLKTKEEKARDHLSFITDHEEESFQGCAEQLKKVILKRIESYALYKNFYLNFLTFLFKVPVIALQDFCIPSPAEIALRKKYSQYVKNALIKKNLDAYLFDERTQSIEKEIQIEMKNKENTFTHLQNNIDAFLS
jgi:hypothetical protein